MEKKRISICEWKAGDIVASDIISENGVPYVVENTEMNFYIQEKLIEFGIKDIYVYELESLLNIEWSNNPEHAAFCDCYLQNITVMKGFIADLSAGNKLSVEQIYTLIRIASIPHCMRC